MVISVLVVYDAKKSESCDESYSLTDSKALQEEVVHPSLELSIHYGLSYTKRMSLQIVDFALINCSVYDTDTLHT